MKVLKYTTILPVVVENTVKGHENGKTFKIGTFFGIFLLYSNPLSVACRGYEGRRYGFCREFVSYSLQPSMILKRNEFRIALLVCLLQT